jgi:hypothetical protein
MLDGRVIVAVVMESSLAWEPVEELLPTDAPVPRAVPVTEEVTDVSGHSTAMSD